MKVISIENGVAIVVKACKGCGQPFELEIPANQIETENCNEIRCLDCLFLNLEAA